MHTLAFVFKKIVSLVTFCYNFHRSSSKESLFMHTLALMREKGVS